MRRSSGSLSTATRHGGVLERRVGGVRSQELGLVHHGKVDQERGQEVASNRRLGGEPRPVPLSPRPVKSAGLVTGFAWKRERELAEVLGHLADTRAVVARNESGPRY